MKRAVLLLLVCLGASWAAPVDQQEGPEEANCTDPRVLGAARLAMDKINKDRTEGYVFSLHTLVNAHTQKHGENSAVFYLTMNILETNCNVLSKKNYKDCQARDFSATPVYGQCKVAIFISRVHRVTRLYKYDCAVRRASAAAVQSTCPDCPLHTDKNSEAIQGTVSKSLAKFNKESGLSKHFALRKITRATASWVMGMMYHVEYTIQETTCANGVDKPEDCPVMDCEFTHYGFCTGSDMNAPRPPPDDGQTHLHVNCEIYEPEAAVREKALHAAATDHSHTDTQAADPAQSQVQSQGPDRPSHPHDHAHMHNYEHQHPHQGQADPTPPHRPEGMWKLLLPLDSPVTLPAFPDLDAAPGPGVGVTLPLKPDPQIPGQTEPTIGPFPTKLSAQCPPPPDTNDFVSNLFTNDPKFNLAA